MPTFIALAGPTAAPPPAGGGIGMPAPGARRPRPIRPTRISDWES